MREARPASGELFEHRRLGGSAATRADRDDRLIAEIVGEDEDDIGLRWSGRILGGVGRREDREQQSREGWTCWSNRGGSHGFGESASPGAIRQLQWRVS